MNINQEEQIKLLRKLADACVGLSKQMKQDKEFRNNFTNIFPMDLDNTTIEAIKLVEYIKTKNNLEIKALTEELKQIIEELRDKDKRYTSSWDDVMATDNLLTATNKGIHLVSEMIGFIAKTEEENKYYSEMSNKLFFLCSKINKII
jgi:predicted RND superfamily exporter protein